MTNDKRLMAMSEYSLDTLLALFAHLDRRGHISEGGAVSGEIWERFNYARENCRDCGRSAAENEIRHRLLSGQWVCTECSIEAAKADRGAKKFAALKSQDELLAAAKRFKMGEAVAQAMASFARQEIEIALRTQDSNIAQALTWIGHPSLRKE